MANTFLHPPRIEPIYKPKNGIVQPPVMPTAQRPGRNTNQLKFLLEKVVKTVWYHDLASPFREPVNAKELQLPDYHKKIKRAMDLGTIKKRLENGFYWRSAEALEDFNLVFKNCYQYNREGDEVIAMAEQLERMFHTKLKQMPKVEKEIFREAPRKKDRRKTVSFAPNVTIAEPAVYSSEEKKAKSRKKVAEKSSEAAPQTKIAAENSIKSESQPQSKGLNKTISTAKSRKGKAEKSPEPTTSIETISIGPAALKAKGRRKTISPAISQNVDAPAGSTTSAETVPATLEEPSIEPVVQVPKERKKIGRPAKPRKQAETPPGASSTTATGSNENIEKSTKSPTESSTALKAKEPKRTVAPKKSRKKATETLSEATTSTETVPNVNPNEIPVTETKSAAIEENVEKLPTNERVENVKKSLSNNRLGNNPNQLRNSIQLDELSERGANDSGVDSIPEDLPGMKMKLLEKQLLAISSELQRMKRDKWYSTRCPHGFGCFHGKLNLCWSV